MKENEVLRRRAEDSSSIILHNFNTNGTSSKKKMESNKLVEKEEGEWSEPEEEFGPYTPREDDERIVVELKKDENGIETRRVYKKICNDCGAEGSDRTRSPTPSVPEEESEKESEVRGKKRTSPDRTQDIPSNIRKKNHSKYSFYYSSIPLNCFLFSLLYSTPMSLWLNSDSVSTQSLVNFVFLFCRILLCFILF